jgi:hypothetical protein
MIPPAFVAGRQPAGHGAKAVRYRTSEHPDAQSRSSPKGSPRGAKKNKAGKFFGGITEKISVSQTRQ